jgi:hypothetical protein
MSRLSLLYVANMYRFALLTGKPPFQSTTQDEIYRKAREREYDWPKLSTSDNYIGQEAKDLVSTLLQSPEDRPSPDIIVQHPFFSCGWVPQAEEMLPNFREEAPSPNDFLSAGLRGGRANLYAKSLKKLCIKSDVGPYCTSKKIPMRTWKEVAAEELAGLTPAVPLPAGTVYRPFDEVKEEHLRKLETGESASTVSKGSTDSQAEGVLEKRRTETKLSQNSEIATATQLTASRAAPQSFAAQQRASHQPGPSGTATRPKRPLPTSERASSSKSVSSTEGVSKSRSTIASSRRQAKPPLEAQLRQEREPLVVLPVASSEERIARIAADLVQNLNDAAAECKPQGESGPSIKPENPISIFHPQERPELLLQTRPFHILRSLQKLNAELERALNSRSIGSCPTDKPKPSPNIVVKWVDYTNKFGLGYILSNGSVGCIFKSSVVSSGSSSGEIPPTCVVVRDAEKHLQARARKGYPDRMQLIPQYGAPVEFYERGERGISMVKVPSYNFKITGEDGEAGKLRRGKDEYDDRKREKIVIWNKFANYMTAFGRDQDYPFDDALQRVTPESQVDANDAGNVVTFYQRFGDVGCWNFGDGHFQVRSLTS